MQRLLCMKVLELQSSIINSAIVGPQNGENNFRKKNIFWMALQRSD